LYRAAGLRIVTIHITGIQTFKLYCQADNGCVALRIMCNVASA